MKRRGSAPCFTITTDVDVPDSLLVLPSYSYSRPSTALLQFNILPGDFWCRLLFLGVLELADPHVDRVPRVEQHDLDERIFVYLYWASESLLSTLTTSDGADSDTDSEKFLSMDIQRQYVDNDIGTPSIAKNV